MSESLIVGGIGLLTTVVSWFLAKKKYNTEVESNIIQNMQETLDFYKKVSDDNKQRLKENCEENEALRKSNIALKEELDALKVENKTLKEEIEALKNQLKTLTAAVKKIEGEHSRTKKTKNK